MQLPQPLMVVSSIGGEHEGGRMKKLFVPLESSVLQGGQKLLCGEAACVLVVAKHHAMPHLCCREDDDSRRRGTHPNKLSLLSTPHYSKCIACCVQGSIVKQISRKQDMHAFEKAEK